MNPIDLTSLVVLQKIKRLDYHVAKRTFFLEFSRDSRKIWSIGSIGRMAGTRHPELTRDVIRCSNKLPSCISSEPIELVTLTSRQIFICRCYQEQLPKRWKTRYRVIADPCLLIDATSIKLFLSVIVLSPGSQAVCDENRVRVIGNSVETFERFRCTDDPLPGCRSLNIPNP